MLPIVDRPMIERVVAHLGAHGVDEAVLSLGYRPDAFADAYPDGTCAGVAAALRRRARAARHRGRHPLRRRRRRHRRARSSWSTATSSPTSTSAALMAFHDERGAEGTIALHPVDDPSRVRRRAHRRRRPGHGVRREAAARTRRPPTHQRRAPTCSSPRVLDRIADGRKVSIERETFPAMVADGALYAIADGDAYWIDTGTPATYLAGAARPHRRSPAARPTAAVAPDAPRSTPTPVVEHAVIGAGVAVGAGATCATPWCSPAPASVPAPGRRLHRRPRAPHRRRRRRSPACSVIGDDEVVGRRATDASCSTG